MLELKYESKIIFKNYLWLKKYVLCCLLVEGTERLQTANLVAALIPTKLDYGNALLAGLPHTSVVPYQRVINAAVRVVSGLRYRDHVTSAEIKLHWLPAEARIQYKLCLLIHHALAAG